MKAEKKSIKVGKKAFFRKTTLKNGLKKSTIVNKKTAKNISKSSTQLLSSKKRKKYSVMNQYAKFDFINCEKLNDSELVKFVIEKNPEAYKILFKRYEKILAIYIFHFVRNKEEVEDLLQDVFLKTFKNLRRFDQERKFSSWIYRISHNEAVNFIKRKSKRRLVSWEEIMISKDKLVISADTEDAAEIFMHKEIAEDMDSALNMLPIKYKKILLLRYFNEYSYQKIGDIMGKPVNTVGTLINRAKRKLVQVIQEKDNYVSSP